MGLPWVFGLAVLAWLGAVVAVLLSHRHLLARLWREPVWRRPVLVIESDDWGAGPLAQAPALRQMADVLQRHRDGSGRAALMNLALVLSVPDGPAIRAGAGYQAVALDDPLFAPILAALRDGSAQGVFALQLHGLAHYWPPSLVASDDPAVQAWLRGDVPATTEQLPSHLQSRWVDAARLPSSPLPPDAAAASARNEVQVFEHIVGERPTVVVPPTFVWTRDIEQAWSAAGIQFVVTPGRRCTLRDARGQPAGEDAWFANGDRGQGVVYLARTDYFEPSRGRDARYALDALARNVAEGRPCVLENHRDNFIADPQAGRRALAELDSLLREALARHPGLCFMSTRELGALLRDGDARWLVTAPRQRLPALWTRLQRSGPLWKWLRLTGAAALGGGLVRALAAPSTQGLA